MNKRLSGHEELECLRMKLSCLPVSLYPELTAKTKTLPDWFEFAARLGLDGADLSIVHLESRETAYLQEVRRQAGDLGLQITMMVTYADFTHPDGGERQRQLDEIKQLTQVAAHLGAQYMRVTAGQAHPGVERAEGIEWAVAGLLGSLDAAAEAGVTLTYENHTKGYGWTYNDFSQPTAIFLEIMRRTEGSELKLLFDTANTVATGDDPLPVLDEVKHRVAAIHANDVARWGAYEPVVHGTGVAPILSIYQKMVAAGFDGWISVEEASKQGEQGFVTAVNHADQLWVQAGGRARAKQRHT
jgi:sugar phosphate isomerase/epimerase